MDAIVIGAGRMGRAIALDLKRSGFGVRVVDQDPAAADRLARDLRVEAGRGDAAKPATLAPLLAGADVAVSAVPYFLNYGLAREAVRAGTHFVDLGGNDAVVKRELGLDAAARRRGVCVVPDAGLAPGMVSFLAAWGVSRFTRADRVRIRVGGLPQRPVPPLNYQLVFSTEGLVNEYSGWCRVLKGGRLSRARALTGVEELDFPGIGRLEAFHTSGGASTLPLSYRGKVGELEYKTLRYPGHAAAVRELFARLGREGTKRHLDRTVPREGREMVLVLVEVEGRRAGRNAAWRLSLVDRGRAGLSSMMRTTGFSASIVAQLVARGKAKRAGALLQERDFDPADYVRELRKRDFDLRVSSR